MNTGWVLDHTSDPHIIARSMVSLQHQIWGKDRPIPIPILLPCPHGVIHLAKSYLKHAKSGSRWGLGIIEWEYRFRLSSKWIHQWSQFFAVSMSSSMVWNPFKESVGSINHSTSSSISIDLFAQLMDQFCDRLPMVQRTHWIEQSSRFQDSRDKYVQRWYGSTRLTSYIKSSLAVESDSYGGSWAFSTERTSVSESERPTNESSNQQSIVRNRMIRVLGITIEMRQRYTAQDGQDEPQLTDVSIEIEAPSLSTNQWENELSDQSNGMMHLSNWLMVVGMVQANFFYLYKNNIEQQQFLSNEKTVNNDTDTNPNTNTSTTDIDTEQHVQ